MKHIQRFFLSIFLLAFTGTCLAVPAGVNWQWANPTPQGNPFNAVAYSNVLNAHFAVGDLSNIVFSTDEGSNWTVEASGTTQNLNSVFAANLAVYIFGNNETLLVRTDTSRWLPQNSGTTVRLNGLAINSTKAGRAVKLQARYGFLRGSV